MNVYHNWGRWIVDCPSPDCVASLKADSTLVVCDCRDQDICAHGPLCATPVTVEWPDQPDEIVRLLAVRPVANRHWYPHETIEDLERENMEHGVTV